MCTSWERLFLDVVKTQGVDHQGQEITIQTNAYQDITEFLVNGWEFSLTPSLILQNQSNIVNNFIQLGFEYINILYPNFDQYVEGENQYKFVFSEVIELTGISGQNTSNPLSDFGFHHVAKLNDIYYDPSYGGAAYQLSDSEFITSYENNNISGYKIQMTLHNINESLFIIDGQPVDLNLNGEIDTEVTIKVWLIKKNTSAQNNLYIHSTSNY